MDIKIMEYYLAVTREGNISSAAEALHISQPALSRQIKELEDELGVTLFTRGNRKITLTEEGMILRRRAEEMVRLMQLTESEITMAKNTISGDVRIGAGESLSFHYLSQTAGQICKQYPDIRFHVTSGDTDDLMEQLNNGLIDFALLFTDFDRSLYHSIMLPQQDCFGVLMRRDSELAEKEYIRLEDLYDLPLILARASSQFFLNGMDTHRLNIVATYNLIYNASLLVEDGVGYALTFNHLINVTGDSALCFRPLLPEVGPFGTLIWKKYQVLTPAVRLFIDTLNDFIECG